MLYVGKCSVSPCKITHKILQPDCKRNGVYLTLHKNGHPKNDITCFQMKKKETDTQLSLFPDFDFTPPESDALHQLLDTYDHTALFERLAKSDFRSRFHLSIKDKTYITERGLDTIRKHAEDFVAKRLAPAEIYNDERQTPMRGHPVFVAQHATGCCCRGCFSKWHHIPDGRPLTPEEQRYAVSVLMSWIYREYNQK